MQNERIEYAKQIQSGVVEFLNRRSLQSSLQISTKLSHCVVSVALSGLDAGYLNPLLKLATRREITMRCGLDQSNVVRTGWDRKRIYIEAPFPEKLRKIIRASQIPTDTNDLIIGADTRMQSVTLDPDNISHMFICGATQGGKTNFQQYLTYRLLQSGYDAYVVSTIKEDWNTFNGKVDMCSSPDKASTLLDASLNLALNNILDRTTYIVIDEVKNIIEDNPSIGTQITKIAELGSGGKLKLILATQYPNISVLGNNPTLKRNVTARVSFNVDDATASYNVLGMPNAGAEALSGKGDGILRIGSTLRRFTAPLMESDLLASLPDVLTYPDEKVRQVQPNTNIEDKLDEILSILKKPTKSCLLVDEMIDIITNDMTIAQIRTKYGWGSNRASKAKQECNRLMGAIV